MKYTINEFSFFTHYVPKVTQPTTKQIVFLTVLFISLVLLASHYDYLILN